MPGQRSRPRSQPPGGAGTRLGRALVRTDQGSRRAHGGAAAQAGQTRGDRDRVRARLPARGPPVSRRILVALLTLIIAVVAGAMVPVAMNAVNQDRTSFIGDEEAAVRTYAALEQTTQSTGKGNAALVSVLADAEKQGNYLLVYPIVLSARYADFGMPLSGSAPFTLETRAENADRYEGYVPHPIYATVGPWSVAGIAINRNGVSPGEPIAVVLLAESSAPLNNEIRNLWTVLIAVGVAGLLAAALIAGWLARWLSKPLAGLDNATRRLADGDLTVRAKPDYGPPEVRRLARTFNTMAGRLENLVHGSRAVLADVSHQLRTPLAALRLRLDFLAAEAA